MAEGGNGNHKRRAEDADDQNSRERRPRAPIGSAQSAFSSVDESSHKQALATDTAVEVLATGTPFSPLHPTTAGPLVRDSSTMILSSPSGDSQTSSSSSGRSLSSSSSSGRSSTVSSSPSPASSLLASMAMTPQSSGRCSPQQSAALHHALMSSTLGSHSLTDRLADVSQPPRVTTPRVNVASGARMPKASLRTHVSVTFDEAALGCNKVIAISRKRPCWQCSSSDSNATSSASSAAAHAAAITAAAAAAGAADSADRPPPCGWCSGERRIAVRDHLIIGIPAGARNEIVVVIQNEGDWSPASNTFGDLLVVVHVQPHTFFSLAPNGDVACVLPISYSQAALGAQLQFPGVGGVRLGVSIPAGVHSGTVVRLPKLGYPRALVYAPTSATLPDYLQAPRGELIITLMVRVPQHLNERQIQILEELERIDLEQRLRAVDPK